MAENLVTQVTQGSGAMPLTYDDDGASNFNSKIHLNIRGKPFTITRDELMSLPESILLSLFPNGVFLDFNGQVIANLTEEDVVFVYYDPACFEYILRTFNDAHADLQDMALSPQVSAASRLDASASVLQTKPAIIVLREDLDYYVIPPEAGCSPEQMKAYKVAVADKLMENMSIFWGLGYDPALPAATVQKLGPAEQHLFDMLCTSGFDRAEQWGNRSLEPNKCAMQSLSLVRLTTPQASPPESPALGPVGSNTLGPVPSNASGKSRSRSRIATLASSATRAASRSLSRARKNAEANHSKLLLFWRKPARKCWWSNEEVEVAAHGVKLKVHIRRVWTLELSVVGIQ